MFGHMMRANLKLFAAGGNYHRKRRNGIYTGLFIFGLEKKLTDDMSVSNTHLSSSGNPQAPIRMAQSTRQHSNSGFGYRGIA